MLEIDGSAVIVLFLIVLIVWGVLRLTYRKAIEKKVFELAQYKVDAEKLIHGLYERATQAKEVDPESAVTVDMIEKFRTQQKETTMERHNRWAR